MKKVSLSNIAFVVIIAAGFLYYLYLKGYIFANFENLEPKEAYQLLQKEKDKIVLLDVRNPEEIKTDGKIPGSILIPLGTLAQNIDKLDKNKKIMVYCHSGMRSVSAARLLSSVGFKVLNIKGGILNWKSEGLPIEK
ncbi:rhodanese-like domain-containing protein [Persephonella sp. KM09-Lau-8]|uniref:rhodanese-like domain-containing protein n=1 Tax=Persephonella sp. KM09-Lau-8 TaxID=1158345 RepID=UPI0004983D5C|nr:rhodanese-like domain-containing protein [Persephonella sp. KM09-Lau-8]